MGGGDDGSRRCGAQAELVAFWVGEDVPATLSLPDISFPCAEGEESVMFDNQVAAW